MGDHALKNEGGDATVMIINATIIILKFLFDLVSSLLFSTTDFVKLAPHFLQNFAESLTSFPHLGHFI